MSDFHCEVTKLLNIQPHPMADKLDVAEANGYHSESPTFERIPN